MSDTLDSIDLTKPKVKEPVDADSITLKPKVKDHIAATPDAIKLARKYDPDGEGKLKFADAAASVTGMSKPFIYSNSENVAQHYFGKPTKPDSAAKMINDTFHDYTIDDKLNDIAGQAYGREYTEAEKTQMKELEAQKRGGGLKGFPKGVLDFVHGIVGTVIGTVEQAGAGVEALSEDIQGLAASAMTLGGLASDNSTGEAHFRMGQEAAQRFVTKVAGASYRQKRAAGESVASATITSGALAVFNNMMLTFPAGKLGDAIAPVAAETVAKVAGSTAFWAAGNVVAKNGAFASANAAGTILINEFGKNLANKVDGKTFTWDDYGTVMKEFAEQAGEQTVAFSLLHGVAKVGGKFAQGLKGVSDKAETLYEEPRTSPGEAGGVKAVSVATKADQFIDEAAKDRQMAAAAKDHVAAMPIGDLDKPIPYEDIPRETPKTGGPVVDPLDKQVAKDPRVVTAKAQVPADSNRVSNIENQVYQEKFTEQHPAVVEAKKALQVALDDPTQADKVASLTEAFQSARKEANMMAAERGTQRVARERARVERVATRNKAIDQLKGVNPDIMSKESGDVVRAIQDHFFPEKEAKARARGATLDLDALKKNLDEAKDRVSPSIDLEALGKLPKNIRDIPPEDFQTIVDAVKNHDLIRKMEGKIRTVEGDIRRATFQESAEKDIGEPKKSILGDKAAEIRDQLRTGVKTLTDSPEYLGEWAFGGKRTPTYEAVTAGPERAKPHVEPRAHSYKSEAKAIAKATLGIDKRDFSEADSIKWNKYYGEEFTEDGVTLNRNDIMDSYMHFLNENNKKSLLEGGTKFTSKSVRERFKEGKQRISEDTYQKLFKHLTPSDHLVLEAAGRMTEKTGADINSKYHVPKYGFPMTIEDHYWPKDTVNEGKSYEEDIQDIQKAARKLDGSGLNKGMLKKRTGDTGAIYTHGFWSTLERHANDAALLTEMGPAYDAAHEVLHDQKVSDRLSAVHSPELTATLQRALERTAGQHETSHGLEKGLDTAGNVATNLMLGSVKTLTVVPKMLALGARSMVKNPVAGVQAFVDMTLHPRVTREEARMLSPRVDTAYRKGTTLDQTQLKRLQTKTGVVRAIGRKVQRANMAAVKWSSMESYLFDATVAKRQVELESRNVERWNDRLETARRMQATANTPHEKVLAQSMVDKAQKGFDESMSDDVVGATGMTPKDVLKASPEAMTKAKGDYGNNIIGETHATNDPMHMVGLQTTALGRIATKFATEPLKAGEVIRRTIMQVHRAPTFSNVSRLTRTLAFYGIAEGAIFYGVKEAKDLLLGKKPSKQAARETEWQKLGGEIARADISMVGGGQQIQQVIDTKKYPYSAHGGAVEETIRMPIEMVVNAITAVTGATAKERGAAVKQMLKMARSYVGLAADITDMGAK